MTLRAVVKGVGHYLPARVVPNAELEALVQTSDEWIRSRSGIERRHFVAEGQTTSDLATLAAQAALSHAGLAPDDIDAVVKPVVFRTSLVTPTSVAFVHTDDNITPKRQ